MPAPFQLLSDEELARQAQAGSLAAFEALVTRYERRLCAFVANLGPNAAAARDITQDTFVRAFQAIAQFNHRHTFAAWLFTIARHKAADHRRASLPYADGPLPELADNTDPAEVLARREAGQDLWRLARAKLPELQFQALWLRYAEELPVVEVARVLGRTRTHVKVLLFRARQTLCRELARCQAAAASTGHVSAAQPPGRHAPPLTFNASSL